MMLNSCKRPLFQFYGVELQKLIKFRKLFVFLLNLVVFYAAEQLTNKSKCQNITLIHERVEKASVTIYNFLRVVFSRSTQLL